MVKLIKIPIYNCTLHLIYNEPDIPKYLRKKHSIDWKKEDVSTGRACFFTLTNPTDYAIWVLKSPIDIPALVHEASHVTNQILKDRGAITEGNDEPFCYLLEYLVDSIFNVIPKEEIKQFGN